MRLVDKVAIVTGASQGIGRATAVELARNGADIAVNYWGDDEPARAAAEQIRSLGRRVLLFKADVADRRADEEMVAETARAFGAVDILVANAAHSVRKAFLDLEVEDLEKTWNVSLWGTFHTCQLAARQMVHQGRPGSLTIISSVHAYRPFPKSSAYNGAKAAVNQMALTWAAELAPHGIRVNVIEPGWIDTPSQRRRYSEGHLEAEGRKLPLGRIGTPEEVARGVVFLASADASYITGTCLRIDGGFVLPYRRDA